MGLIWQSEPLFLLWSVQVLHISYVSKQCRFSSVQVNDFYINAFLLYRDTVTTQITFRMVYTTKLMEKKSSLPMLISLSKSAKKMLGVYVQFSFVYFLSQMLRICS